MYDADGKQLRHHDYDLGQGGMSISRGASPFFTRFFQDGADTRVRPIPLSNSADGGNTLHEPSGLCGSNSNSNSSGSLRVPASTAEAELRALRSRGWLRRARFASSSAAAARVSARAGGTAAARTIASLTQASASALA